METKTESELIISRNDVMVKQRIAFRGDGLKQRILEFKYPFLIVAAKAKDKFGNLIVKKLNDHSIQVTIKRTLSKNKPYALEISILIKPEITKIGGIRIFNWGSMDLYKVTSLVKPFQVIGFLRYEQSNNQYIYTENISKNITSHIAKYRSTRIEIGTKLQVRLILRYKIHIPDGTKLINFKSFGPLNNSRQRVKLLTSNIEVEYDYNKNPYYVLNEVREDSFQLRLEWIVTVNKPPPVDTNLGSTKALQIAIRDSERLRQLIEGNEQTWHIQDNRIQSIAMRTKEYQSIFDIHKFLFEFTNRRINYNANGIRYSPIEALEKKIGDCSEYSDLLVTLHRAAGLPSKVIEGVILNTDADKTAEGHAWVEFLSTKGWISCDPTWGFHLGISAQHIAFNSQKNYAQTHMYEMNFQGSSPPEIVHSINWDYV